MTDRLHTGDDFYDEPVQHMGGISGIGLPFDLDDEEAERVYAELLERERKRRPCGFTATWPDAPSEPPT